MNDEPIVTDIEVVERGGMAEMDRIPLSGVEAQIEAARRYPRNIARALEQAVEMATSSPDLAEACIFNLPKQGKTISGMSVRAAEILAFCWGNLRVSASVGEAGERMVTAQGMAWDVERNVAVQVAVPRSIMDRNNNRYSDSVIVTTAQAAVSLAVRNAIFRVIPPPVRRELERQIRAKLLPPTAQVLAQAQDAVAWLDRTYKVSLVQMCAALGRARLEDITGEDLVTLRGFVTAIREGQSTVEEVFGLATKGAAAAPDKLRNMPKNGDSASEPAKAPTSPPERRVEPVTEDPPFEADEAAAASVPGRNAMGKQTVTVDEIDDIFAKADKAKAQPSKGK